MQCISPKKSVCDLCNDTLNKGQDILTCEGDCACYVHRYCAGVTASHFEEIGKGSTPFVCQWCLLKTSNVVIKQLQAEVASLKADLTVVRAQISTKDSEHTASLNSDLADLRAQPSKKQDLSTKQSYASAAMSPGPHKCTTSSPRERERPSQALRSPKPASTGKVKVEGARRVWGTMKSCPTTAVTGAMSKLTSVSTTGFRGKYKLLHNNKSAGGLLSMGKKLISQLLIPSGRKLRCRRDGP